MPTTSQAKDKLESSYLVKIPGTKNLFTTAAPKVISRNVTAFAYSSKFPLGENPEPSMFIVADEYNCPHEFQTWEDARQYYINQSSHLFVGLWRIFVVYGLSQLPTP